jgi:uncharacterized protein
MSVGAHADAAPIPALLNTIAVAIMAKAPWPGAVKTRLCPPLLAAEAAELYRCFLLDKISAVQALVGARPVVAFTPDEAQAEYATLASLLEAGHPGAIAVDSDTPTLPREFLQQAIDCLSRPGPDVVLGPTDDGGYYLIGVRAAHRALFDGVPWSTSAVLEITLRQAAAAGLQTVCMPAWFDVDTPDDLRRLETVLDGSPPAKETGQTGRFLASLRR